MTAIDVQPTVTAETEVVFYDVEDEENATITWRGTFGEFIVQGEYEPLEILRIHRILSTRKRITFGGGAEPVTLLRLASEVV